jgi:hypothetical protein
MKKLLTIAVLTLTTQAFALDLSALTGGESVSGVNKSQLKSIVLSEKAYCIKVQGTNYLASVGARKLFNEIATTRTRSVRCNDKMKRQAMLKGVKVIQLSKTKMNADAYQIMAQAMIKAFGV